MAYNSQRRRMLALVSAAAMLPGTAALAQAAAPPDTGRGASILEELVVTAQRREESIQDVPIAVSAFSADNLKSQRIETGQDLLQAVPNVNFSRGNFGGYNFQIRGIGTKLVATSADAAIGIHENNVPLTANTLADAEFYDVERVEVLRGPQGTQFGRNTTGGLVNVITNKPTDEFGGRITAELGNYNTKRINGAINLPMGDGLALRVAGAALKRDGFRNLPVQVCGGGPGAGEAHDNALRALTAARNDLRAVEEFDDGTNDLLTNYVECSLAYPIAPNRLGRNFTTQAPNQVWLADLTYIPTGEGWLYLASVLDLHTRKIVGWCMRPTLHVEIALDALHMAIQRQRPAPGLIHHSDRGIQYAAEAYRSALAVAGITPSMSRKGDCWDNAPMESFFHTLKTERVHHRVYATREQARRDLFQYIEGFYNPRRLHSALGYISPAEAERRAA